MVVQHNLTAMNSNRMLNITTKRQAKGTERLSSGYKINRAADDAAGLAISEKMRKQIRGLTQAALNAQDGISMVQTADGAMAEVDDMLHRLNELSVKAANGTLSDDDRKYIQQEADQLLTEIDRVATTTKFNETFVLNGDNTEVPTDVMEGKLPGAVGVAADGSFSTKLMTETVQALSVNGILYEGEGVAVDLTTFTANDIVEMDGFAFQGSCMTCDDVKVIKFVDGHSDNYTGPTSAGVFEIDISLKALNKYLADPTAKAAGVDTLAEAIGWAVENDPLNKSKIGESSYNYNVPNDPVTGLNPMAGADWVGGPMHGSVIAIGTTDGTTKDYSKLVILDVRGYGLTPDPVTGKPLYWGSSGATDGTKSSYGFVKNGYLDDFVELIPAHAFTSLHVGADSSRDNKIEVELANVSTAALGLRRHYYIPAKDKHVYTSYVDLTTEETATETIDLISGALKYVSEERSRMGAYQNRLEHTIANLDNVVENTTAAESAIRDTDMATQMVEYSNNNILAQAGQAMLAQANQSNQGVLSLLG